jgi:5,10-methylenetetrahydromethanopterin reductase
MTGLSGVSLGVSLAPPDLAEVGPFASWAQARGFGSLWFGEGRMRRDAIVPMTLAAQATTSVRISSGVIPMRTRNVALLATTFKTLHDLAPGRIQLGLGAWWEPIASRVGLPTASPLTAMREVITVLRGLFAGESVTLRGGYVDVDGIKFDAPQDDASPSYDIPIVVGAVGDRMLRLAGELADGVLLDFFVPPAHTAHAVTLLAERTRVSQLVACCVDDDDPKAAVEECRFLLARYLAQQPHIARGCGADPGLVEALRSRIGWPATSQQVRDAMHLVPASLVDACAACGTASRVVERIEEYVEAGCQEPVLVPFGDRRGTLEAILCRRR